MNLPIYMLVERGIGMNIVRIVFAYLDMVTFKLFSWLMQAIFDIANLTLVKESVFEALQERVYVILGIFMLFKLTMSLLSYLVNPDKINDKERGISKIVTRTVVSLCMLVSIPAIFNLLYEAQEPILDAVPRIILGKATTVSSITSQSESLGNKIAWSTYGLVFPIEKAENFNTVDAVPDHINDPGADNSVYKYDYIPLLGMVIAVIMSFILLGICIDVAIRSFKLAILRMIAPIPIISYIDPKSSKDGMFQNYIKTLASTYLDLFIQIGVLYFVLMMIDEVLFGGITLDGLTGVRAVVATVFIIIGLLFFARQFPNFIRSALGMKNSKGFGAGLGGMLAAGGALLGGAGLAGAAMAGMTAMNENADAAAQGKAGTASWSKGRDLAAQLRTGDKNAKAGITNRLQDRMNIGSSDRQARRLGLSAENVANLKQNMYNKKDELTAAQNQLQEYQAGVESGKYDYNTATMKTLQDNISKAAFNVQKAESAYNDAKAGRESIVGKNGTRDDYARGIFGRGTYRARVNNPHRGNKLEPGADKATGNWSRFEAKVTDFDSISEKEWNELNLKDLEKNDNNTTSQSGVHTDGGGRQPNSDQWDDE